MGFRKKNQCLEKTSKTSPELSTLLSSAGLKENRFFWIIGAPENLKRQFNQNNKLLKKKRI